MIFVNVLTADNINDNLINHYQNSSACLFSLGREIIKPKFNVENVKNKLIQLRNTILSNKVIYADSCGYQFIHGDIKPDSNQAQYKSTRAFIDFLISTYPEYNPELVKIKKFIDCFFF